MNVVCGRWVCMAFTP
nr:hypothetical protein [Vibrio furnissii]